MLFLFFLRSCSSANAPTFCESQMMAKHDSSVSKDSNEDINPIQSETHYKIEFSTPLTYKKSFTCSFYHIASKILNIYDINENFDDSSSIEKIGVELVDNQTSLRTKTICNYCYHQILMQYRSFKDIKSNYCKKDYGNESVLVHNKNNTVPILSVNYEKFYIIEDNGESLCLKKVICSGKYFIKKHSSIPHNFYSFFRKHVAILNIRIDELKLEMADLTLKDLKE